MTIEYQKKRIVQIGVLNGGTTAVAKCFLQHPEFDVYSGELEILDKRKRFAFPDPTNFWNMDSSVPFLYTKERFNHHNYQKQIYDFLPPLDFDTENIIYLVGYRDPAYVLNSWIKRDWEKDDEKSIRRLELNYSCLEKTRLNLIERNINYIPFVFEDFLFDATKHLKMFCRTIGTDYIPEMEWRNPSKSINWEGDFYRPGVEGIDHCGLRSSYDKELLISKSTFERIKESEAGKTYAKICEIARYSVLQSSSDNA